MATWIDNIAAILHRDADVIKTIAEVALEDLDGKPCAGVFDAIRPVPERHMEDPNAEWKWCREHWGTEQDAWVQAVKYRGEGSTALELRFQTEGEPPLALYDFMKAQGFIVMAQYWDSGQARCGTWADGEHHQAKLPGLAPPA